MRLKPSLIFSLKVWLTSVVLSPVIIVLTKLAVLNHEGVISTVKGILGGIAFFIYVGFLLSIPSFLLLWLVTALLVIKSNQSINVKKLMLSAVALLLSFLPLCFLLGKQSNYYDSELFGWLVIYASIILCGVWFYKLPVVEE